jgi:hypothetical protein
MARAPKKVLLGAEEKAIMVQARDCPVVKSRASL